MSKESGENLPHSGQMESSLRERIAAAIDQRYNQEAIGHTYEVCLMAADAVIEQLGLRQAMRSATPTGPIETRYVTDWKADE
jgi:hypothetical protein